MKYIVEIDNDGNVSVKQTCGLLSRIFMRRKDKEVFAIPSLGMIPCVDDEFHSILSEHICNLNHAMSKLMEIESDSFHYADVVFYNSEGKRIKIKGMTISYLDELYAILLKTLYRNTQKKPSSMSVNMGNTQNNPMVTGVPE